MEKVTKGILLEVITSLVGLGGTSIQVLVVVPGFFFIFIFIYLFLFLAALGLRCCAWAFSSCGERGLLFVAVRGLLMAVASLVTEHGL